MLKKISINGLRGFGEKQEIEFSIPYGKEGKWIKYTEEYYICC